MKSEISDFIPENGHAPLIDTPVLIVGGGPVGLSLAAELGWRGSACMLVEEGARPGVDLRIGQAHPAQLFECPPRLRRT